MEKNDTVNFAIERHKVLTITTHTYLGDERRYIDAVLDRYLGKMGLSTLMNNISYCIHEVAGNAHKANLKRLYFDMKGLDIGDPGHYELGMRTFRRDVLQEPKKYTRPHKERGYYIKFHFQIEEPYFRVAIRNNVPLTSQEEARIRHKVRIAEDAASLADVYAITEDYTEGTGLGIVMLHLILRNLGFGGPPFRIFSRNGETIAFLNLEVRDPARIEETYSRMVLSAGRAG